MSEKVQKVLANLGIASRRKIEKWITEGRISVNDAVAKIGQRVSEHDVIRFDGRVVRRHTEKIPTRVLLYNKPEGEICSREDPEARASVFDNLPRIHRARWINVGRLDLNSSGLLLFTNNGELAHRLMHPSRQIEREYAARVLGEVNDASAVRLTHSIELEDGKARFEHIQATGGDGANRWYHVVVMEGRNRLVRRLFEAVGHPVNRLIRVRFGPIILPRSLPQGKWLELMTEEIEQLEMLGN